MTTATIDSFKGPYRWLSNFHLAPVRLDDVFYPSTEHAYQAAKSIDPLVRQRFLTLTCVEAKRLGSKIPLRPDWENIKIAVMYDLTEQKFTKHTDLRAKLLATDDAILVEGNTWHDNFWGECRCGRCGPGRNALGKILMLVRKALR